MEKVSTPKVVTSPGGVGEPAACANPGGAGRARRCSERGGLLALSVGAGLGVVHEQMEAEVTEVVSSKGKHNPDRLAKRHGHNDGSMTLASEEARQAVRLSSTPPSRASARAARMRRTALDS
jgi:hypothetical protein